MISKSGGWKRRLVFGSLIGTSPPLTTGATTPVAGIVVRPSEQVSLFGNYIEGLSRGDVAPVVAVNAGEILSPYQARQIELGVKMDLGRIGGSISGFRIAKPIGELNPAGVFAQTGEQQVRGIEAVVHGNLTSGLDIVGGASLLDSRGVE